MTVNAKFTLDLNQGKRILECRPGMTLFAALRSQKTFLPTGCGARGLCGQCRVKLLAGEANPPTDLEHERLNASDLAAGYRLGCQLRPGGDLRLEVPAAVFAAREYPTTVEDIIPLTPEIRRFRFRLAPGDTIPHQAGQFLNLNVPSHSGVRGVTIRCFSFTTPSTTLDHLDIVVRLNPKGTATPYLFNLLKIGDPISIIAPFGEFYLRDQPVPAVWIAGGSGLSPFLGMLDDLVAGVLPNRPVTLFFGAAKPVDLYYVKELQDLARKHPWFKFIPALSGPEHDPAEVDHGLITEVVERQLSDLSQHEAYLCGGPGMLKACIDILVNKGVAREKIFFDRFG